MEKIIIVGLLISNFVFGQRIEKDTIETLEHDDGLIVGTKSETFKKGAMLVFWGWNFAKYSKSDIRFKGDGYDFQLNNVVAHDRQTKFDWGTYFNPGRITIPQTNVRIAYFIKDNLAIVGGLDHMKYVMDQDQTVDFSGRIDNPEFAKMVKNGQIDLSDEQFLTYEHTDGLNYINFGLEKYKNLLHTKNFDINWGYGAGAGVLFPKTNAKLFGYERSDRFHVAGFGLDARTNLNFILWRHIVARVEVKYGYINLPDVKTRLSGFSDKASQDFTFAQVNFGIGYTFNTAKKSK